MARHLTRALLLTVLVAARPAAGNEGSALGPRGTVYIAQAGPLSQVVTGGQGTHSVLALEIRRPKVEPLRLVVPETDGEETEASPFLIVEPSSETVFIIWQSRALGEQATLKLTTRDGAGWGEVLEIRDNPLSEKGSPQVWVTRDSYSVGLGEETRSVDRAVIHVIWWEDSPQGEQAIYKPLVLIDGVYAGSHPALQLNSLDEGEPEATAPQLATALYRGLRLQSGRSNHSVLVTFADPRTSRLLAVEVAVLPAELAVLARSASAYVLDTGDESADLVALAEGARGHIIGGGVRLHRGLVTLIADLARGHIIGGGSPQYKDRLPAIAKAVSELIVTEGAQMLEDGVGDPEPLGSPRLIELEDAVPAAGLPASFLRLRLLVARAAPVSAEAPTSILAASDGRALLVSWRIGQQIRYRENRRDQWSPVSVLELGAELSGDQAVRILERRVGR